MPTKILKEIVEFFGKKLDHVGVEIKGAEVVTIQGKPGLDGHTPTDDELLAIIRPLIPKPIPGEPGKDGVTPSERELLSLIRPLIPKVKDGKTPTKTELVALIKPLIPDPLQGTPGKDGSPDTGEEIIKKINTDKNEGVIRKEKVEGLADIEDVARTAQANARQVFAIVGSGISWGVPVGTIDDSNTTFTVSTKPIFIIVNGGIYREGKGVYTSYSGGTITLSSPVGTDGFIVSAH